MSNSLTPITKVLAVAALLGASPLYANTNILADTDIKFSGYIKVDAMFSSYSDGTLPSGNLGRDLYIPSLTPVGGTKESTQFDAHARQTRFKFNTTTDDGEGNEIKGHLELDFLVTPGGDERISNSYLPRIRHATINYKGWTLGQTWSTFQDVRTLPESVDFIGITDGVSFARQVMARYKTGAWEFAVENPETTVTPLGGGGRIITDDSKVPDAIVRYSHNADWGFLTVAGLVRQLNYVSGNVIDASATSYGVSINSKIAVGDTDDLRLSFTTGVGLGRYVALNVANGAVLNERGELETIDSTAFAVAYRKVWNQKMRSSFSYSQVSIDNDTALVGNTATKGTSSVSANLLYSPTKKITLGAEIKQATREIESGLDGDMTRVQFMAKYSF